MQVKWPDIDVVISTLNCAKNLERCISCIKKQDYNGQIKIIIVDGGSSDDTVSVAKDYTTEVYTSNISHLSVLCGRTAEC